MRIHRMRVFVCAAIVGLCAAGAVADTALTITARAGDEVASATLSADWTATPQGWSARIPDTAIRGTSGSLLGEIADLTLEIRGGGPLVFTWNGSATAGGVDTEFMLSSPVSPIPGGFNATDGRFAAQVFVTDTGSDGATLTGMGPGNGAFQGYYSGANLFATLIGQVSAGPGGSAGANDSFPVAGYAPFGGPVSDVSSGAHFMLSALDTATFSTTYTIIPEPGAAILLVLGALAIRRR